MREIKFRAWDRTTKTMYTENNDGALRIHLNGSVSICNVWATPDIELMRYTGLKDINDKEIYEGDLFKCVDNEVWGVKFCEFRYSYIAVEVHQPNCDEVLLQFDIEVIGNIYENPSRS